VKGNRNDAVISDEKIENPKRTLRARKEVLVMYKNMSHSCDEANTSNQVTRFACQRKRSAYCRIANDRHQHRRSASDVRVQKSSIVCPEG